MDYVVQDKWTGESQPDHLARADSPLNADQTLKWAVQFCLGMEHAKARGLKCHRDIKPANILITQDGTLEISDFGLGVAAETAWQGTGGCGGSLVNWGRGLEGSFGLSTAACGPRGKPGVARLDIWHQRSIGVKGQTSAVIFTVSALCYGRWLQEALRHRLWLRTGGICKATCAKTTTNK